MSNIKSNLFKKTALATTLALVHQYAFTQENNDEVLNGLEEVIVYAQKKPSTVQNTAASLSVIGGKQALQAATVDAADLLKNVVGVEVQGAARGLVFAIRGLGSDLPPGVGESSVSTNFDSVYSIRAEAGTLGFYDLDRTEVLRGPQGTLYGRNATGGVINFYSKKPVLGETEGYVSAAAGNYGFYRLEGAYNVDLGDTHGLRVAAVTTDRDGYLSNDHMDSEGNGARLKYLFQPSDDFSLMLGYDFIHLGGRGGGGVEDAKWATGDYYETSDPLIGDGQDYNAHKVYANIEANVGPGKLTVIPAYQTAQGDNEGFFGGRGNSGEDPADVTQNSLEVRYSNLEDSKIQWVVGLFHYDYEQAQNGFELSRDGTLGPYQENFNKGESDAIFGQVTIPFSDVTRLTLGGRYTDDHREAFGTTPFPPFSIEGTKDDSFVDWKISIEQDVSEDVMMYAQAATGFRPGGISNFDGSVFDPEELLSYEFGVKSRFWNERAQLNASYFYYDYSGYQVADFFFGPTGPNLVFYNADAVNSGLEMEFILIPTENGKLNISATYLDSEITSDLCLNPFGYFGPSDDSCTDAGAVGLNFNGERLPHAPEYSIKAGYDHRFESSAGWSLTPRVDVRLIDEQFVSANNQEVARQDSYVVGDLSLTWATEDDSLSVSAYVKNVSDEAVKTGYFVGYTLPGAPRTYGINLVKNF